MSATKPPRGIINWGHPLAKGIVFDMPFSEGAGVPVDIGPFHRIPTLQGAAAAAPSPFGQAANFTAIGDGYQFATNGSMTVKQKTTFMTIFKLNSFPDTNKQFLSHIWGDDDDTASTSAVWRIGSQGSAGLAKRFGISFNGTDAENDNDLALDTWYTVVVVTDGTNASWYINRLLDTQKAYSATPPSTTLVWNVGRWSTTTHNDRNFDGKIALVRLWNDRAFNFSQVKQITDNPWAIYV